jgi:hypothetical protein
MLLVLISVREHNSSETASVSFFRLMEGDEYYLGSLRRS